MFIKVSPRWMVNTSEIRSIGCYPNKPTSISVQSPNNIEYDYECGDQQTRDAFFAHIEKTLCPTENAFISEEN